MQDFKLGGAHLKKLRRAEGGAKIFGVFRVKNYNFTPKNHIFSNFRGGRAPPPPWIRPWDIQLHTGMQSVPIDTKMVNSNHAQGNVNSIQHYVINLSMTPTDWWFPPGTLTVSNGEFGVIAM